MYKSGGILDNQNELFLERYKSACNSKGMLNAKDITGTLIYLLSSESQYVNGQNFIIDDGWSCDRNNHVIRIIQDWILKEIIL